MHDVAADLDRTARPATDRAARPGLGVAAAAVCVSALGGAGGLMFGYIDMGAAIDARFPFHSPVLGGLALAALVAAPMGATALAAWRRPQLADRCALAAGVLLMGWAAVQPFVIRSFSWLQPAMFCAGAAVAVAGHRHRARGAVERSDGPSAGR